MNTIKTTHKIGDLVYTADKYDVDRDVIKAIKVEGVKEKVSYGIESKHRTHMYSLFFSRDDGYNWFSSTEIFSTKEEAENLHNSLKAKDEAKQERQRLKKRQERLKRLKEEQAALEAGEDYEEDYGYDD